MRLFDAEGRRLYLTEEERRAFVLAAAKAPREVRTFCGVLHATGCRISEALALTPRQVDLSGRVIVLESLKKRRHGVFRAVPVPPALLDMLDMVHGVRQAQRRGRAKAPLWPWSRMTAYRRVRFGGMAGGGRGMPHSRSCRTRTAMMMPTVISPVSGMPAPTAYRRRRAAPRLCGRLGGPAARRHARGMEVGPARPPAGASGLPDHRPHRRGHRVPVADGLPEGRVMACT